MFTVVITEKGGEQRRLDFDKPEVTIGRVQGNDIILPKGNVSKRHSRIVLKDGKFIVVDLKSTNGTYVNGRKITSPLVIKNSDKIYIGDFILNVDDTSAAPMAIQPTPPQDPARRPPPPLPKRKPRPLTPMPGEASVEEAEAREAESRPPLQERSPSPARTLQQGQRPLDAGGIRRPVVRDTLGPSEPMSAMPALADRADQLPGSQRSPTGWTSCSRVTP